MKFLNYLHQLKTFQSCSHTDLTYLFHYLMLFWQTLDGAEAVVYDLSA